MKRPSYPESVRTESRALFCLQLWSDGCLRGHSPLDALLGMPHVTAELSWELFDWCRRHTSCITETEGDFLGPEPTHKHGFVNSYNVFIFSLSFFVFCLDLSLHLRCTQFTFGSYALHLWNLHAELQIILSQTFQAAWIGGYIAQPWGDFTWRDGTAWTYTNWDEGPHCSPSILVA